MNRIRQWGYFGVGAGALVKKALGAWPLVALPLLLAGCGSQSQPPGNSAPDTATASNQAGSTTTLALEPNTVMVGYAPSLLIPQVLIGIQEGEFTRRINSVAFQDKVLPSDAAVLAALRSGTVDIAYTSTLPAVRAYLASKSLVLLGSCASKNASTGDKPSSQSARLASVYLTTKKFVQANPNFVRRFVAANRDITTDLNANPSKVNTRVLEAWSKASGKKLDSAVAARELKTIRFTSDADASALERSASLGMSAPTSGLAGFLYDPSKP